MAHTTIYVPQAAGVAGNASRGNATPVGEDRR